MYETMWKELKLLAMDKKYVNMLKVIDLIEEKFDGYYTLTCVRDCKTFKIGERYRSEDQDQDGITVMDDNKEYYFSYKNFNAIFVQTPICECKSAMKLENVDYVDYCNAHFTCSCGGSIYIPIQEYKEDENPKKKQNDGYYGTSDDDFIPF